MTEDTTTNTRDVAALLERIRSLTVTEAELVAAGDEAARQQLRRAAHETSWDAGRERGETSPWNEIWQEAFKAGAFPACKAAKERRESMDGQARPETMSDDPVWMGMWRAAWANTADGVAAVASRHLLDPALYESLIRPLKGALGADFPNSEVPDNGDPAELP